MKRTFSVTVFLTLLSVQGEGMPRCVRSWGAAVLCLPGGTPLCLLPTPTAKVWTHAPGLTPFYPGL